MDVVEEAAPHVGVNPLTMSNGSLLDIEAIATLHRGTIDGANFTVAVPKDEGCEAHCLLIYCHGFRPEGMFAEVDDLFWARLVQNGWTVAVTSYRRPGLIVRDAIRDVFNLRNWVVTHIGIPYWCFLDGRSMGGAISVRIAEMPNVSRMIQGVMAIGAALIVKEDDPSVALKYRPTIPILFLTNTSEIGMIEDYISKVKANAEKDRKAKLFGGDEVITPALHSIHREGHNWSNPRERWRAFSCVVEWAFIGSLVSEFQFDGTHPGLAKPGRVEHVTIDGEKFIKCTVTEVEDETTVHSNATLTDLAKVFIRINSRFTLLLADGRRIESVWLGAYPFVGIPDTALVMGENPEDYLCLFALSEFRNKAATCVKDLHLRPGDTFYIVVPKEETRIRKRLQMPLPIEL